MRSISGRADRAVIGVQQVYSLGFRMVDLVEEPASLRAREAPLPRPFNTSALGGNASVAAGVPSVLHTICCQSICCTLSCISSMLSQHYSTSDPQYESRPYTYRRGDLLQQLRSTLRTLFRTISKRSQIMAVLAARQRMPAAGSIGSSRLMGQSSCAHTTPVPNQRSECGWEVKHFTFVCI